MARDDDMTHADTPDVPTRAIRTRTVVLGLVVTAVAVAVGQEAT